MVKVAVLAARRDSFASCRDRFASYGLGWRFAKSPHKTMNQVRLNQLLNQFADRHVLVIGDFFLDKYLILDHSLSERSLETGLEAYQVIEVRNSPGAAGTVVNNLRALGVAVMALGVIGDDGEGYELGRALQAVGVKSQHLMQAPGRFTPTYTKPMMREADGKMHELNRLDIKNRTPLPRVLEAEVIERLEGLAQNVDGIVVADQVEKAECGVITGRVRDALAALGDGGALIAVDSRRRTGQFRRVILKPNAQEALAAVEPARSGDEVVEIPADAYARTRLEEAGEALYRQSERPVFITVGGEGALVFTAEEMEHVPGIPVEGPLDIVGAGDSMMAGLISALACGATPAEAAWIGNLVASITVQQIGMTGTASPEQVRQRNEEMLRFSS